jgi:flagellar FliL protein
LLMIPRPCEKFRFCPEKALLNAHFQFKFAFNRDDNNWMFNVGVALCRFFLWGLAGFLLIFGGWNLIPEAAGDRPAWASEKNSGSGEPGPMVKLTPLVINLNEASGRHYIKTTIVLEIGQKEWVKEVEKRIPSLADMVISTLGDKRLEDLRRPQSREEIKKEILARAQKTLQSPKIKQVYFDEFLFQ